MPSPVEIVRRFRRLRALVIGDAMLDTYVEGSAGRLCTEGPVPVVRKTGEEQVPGGAANAAANVRALGAGVALLGVVGADPAGAQLRAALRTRDVDDRWLVEDAGARTLHKLRILADGQYVVRLDDAAPISRDAFIDGLYARGIGCSVHYIPLHLHPYWRDRYGLQPAQFPHSQRAYERMVSLPLYTRMGEADVMRVAAAARDLLS